MQSVPVYHLIILLVQFFRWNMQLQVTKLVCTVIQHMHIYKCLKCTECAVCSLLKDTFETSNVHYQYHQHKYKRSLK